MAALRSIGADGGEGVPDPRLTELGFGRPGHPASIRLAEHRLRLGVCEGRAELGDLLWLEAMPPSSMASASPRVVLSARRTPPDELAAKDQPAAGVSKAMAVSERDPLLSWPAVVHARIDAVPEQAIVPPAKPALV
jgi:hypothetical protein